MKEISAKQREAIRRALAKPVSEGETGQEDPLFVQIRQEEDFVAQVEKLYRGFAQIRFIIPVFPHAPKVASLGDKEAVCPPGDFTLILDDQGQDCLAAYSSVTEMQRDFPQGRPVAVNGNKLALVACQSPGRVLVDGVYHCSKPLLEAVGVGASYLSPWNNQQLLQHLGRISESCDLDFMGLFPQKRAGLALLARFKKQVENEEAYRQIVAFEAELKKYPEVSTFLPDLTIIPIKSL